MSDTSGIAPVGVTAGNDQQDLAAAQNVGKAILGKASGPVGYGAGQNPFTAAANNVDAQKANILAALAAGGTAGRAALDQANAAIAGQRQAAIQAALSGSATRGVNAGLGSQLGAEQGAIAGMVGSPGQQYGADLAGTARDFTENNNFLQRGFNQYGQEAKAAVPVIEANTQQGLQTRRMEALGKLASSYQAGVGRAQQTADTAAQNDALKNLDLQIAQANLDKAQTEGKTAATKAAATGTTTGSYTALSKQYGPSMAKAAANLGFSSSDVSGIQQAVGQKQFADLMTQAIGLANSGASPAQLVAAIQGYSQHTYGNQHPKAAQLIVGTLQNAGEFAKAPAQPARTQ